MRGRSSILFSFLFCSLAVAVYAQTMEVRHLDGNPRLRDGSGEITALDYDSRLRTGDSVLTGRADQVELAQGNQAVIRIRPNTVFTIRELDTGGQKEQVLTTAAGAVSMRFNRLAGREPRVGTVSTVAGIRGTELTVYAGPDGSSLFIVESGLVSVEAAGKTVDLTENEGVEVSAAGVPGEKFSVIGRELDFSAWAEGRTEAFLADPAGALEGVRTMLAEFRAGLEKWTANYRAAKVESDAAVAVMNAIVDRVEQARYRDEVWFPLALRTGTSVLNYRYYALSAFSLRRYVLGPMYVQMRSRNILVNGPGYPAFLEAYKAVLEEYRAIFGPYLGSVDF